MGYSTRVPIRIQGYLDDVQTTEHLGAEACHGSGGSRGQAVRRMIPQNFCQRTNPIQNSTQRQ